MLFFLYQMLTGLCKGIVPFKDTTVKDLNFLSSHIPYFAVNSMIQTKRLCHDGEMPRRSK